MRGGWAEQLRDGYLRLDKWIFSTAPQLKIVLPIPPEKHPANARSLHSVNQPLICGIQDNI